MSGCFLSLVGLTALLVGGVGIGNAIGNFIAGKTATIATLKCLGASNRLVFATYLLEVLALAVLGIAVALALGAMAPVVVSPLLARGPSRLASFCDSSGAIGLGGVVRAVDDSRLLSVAVGRESAKFLLGHYFATGIDRARRRVPAVIVGTTAVVVLGLAALAVSTAPDRKVALWFVAGALAAFALFRAAGRRSSGPRSNRPASWRGAGGWRVANLHRPGAPTARIVLSLGIGLSVLVAIALVEGNLAHEMEARMLAEAPRPISSSISSPISWPASPRSCAQSRRAVRPGADDARPHHPAQRRAGRGGSGRCRGAMGPAQRPRPDLRGFAAAGLAARAGELVAVRLPRSAARFV